MKNTMVAHMVTLLMLAWISDMALAQDITGTWEGALEVAPDTEITVRFDLSPDDGGDYQAVLNSPDAGAIKAIKAESVSFNGTQLTIDVPSLSGSYMGAWSGEGFEGEWQQPGSVLPMNLKPYVPTEVSQETIDVLLGQWRGKLKVPGGEYAMLFHFEMDEAGEFTGITQNVDFDSERWEITDIRLEQDEIFFRNPQINAEYQGTLSDDTITGSWIQGGDSYELNVSRGDNTPPATEPESDQ